MGTIWPSSLGDTSGPKYAAVAATIRRAVAAGDLGRGAKLPPVRELAYRLQITPGTVARAYSLLTDEGLLEATVGRGTFVAAEQKPQLPQGETGLIEVDAVPHGSNGVTYPISFLSPALPEVGQAALIRRLLGEVAANPPSGVMHYPSGAASGKARTAALDWLAQTPLGALDESDIVLAHGAQNASMLILQTVLRGRTPLVLIEELAYPGFRRAPEMLRADVAPVAMDRHGIIPEALDAAAAAGDTQVLCTCPEVHNPTVIFTPAERREELVEVARARNLQILEDDTYRIGPAQAPFYRTLAPERTWYVSSISKSLTPALRIGFAIAPHGQGAALRRSAEHSFFGLSAPIVDLAARLLTDPETARIAEKVRAATGALIRSAVNHLGAYDVAWREDVPFLWLHLPAVWRSSAFCLAAEAEGIRVRPADHFAPRDGKPPHAVRIAINGQIDREHFDAAMKRLADLLANPPERIGV